MVSNHGQVLERYTFPNWVRVVYRLNRKKKIPSVVVPQDNETFGVTGFLTNSEHSQGMLLLWFIVHLRSYI